MIARFFSDFHPAQRTASPFPVSPSHSLAKESLINDRGYPPCTFPGPIRSIRRARVFPPFASKLVLRCRPSIAAGLFTPHRPNPVNSTTNHFIPFLQPYRMIFASFLVFYVPQIFHGIFEILPRLFPPSSTHSNPRKDQG